MIEPFLPIGIQSFEQIRTGGFVYVDKTRFLHEWVRPGQGFYFLARPRRFGKSLAVSTLQCLFQGKRELFEGLWIAEHGQWDWAERPVVVFDFNELGHETPETFRKSLDDHLLHLAEFHDLSLKNASLPGSFVELITTLSEKAGKRVAVLVDEYDKPIISHLGQGSAGMENAKENRKILKSLFGVLKGTRVSPCLRFVFLTGVSKFSRVSIFSDLNNLEDLSMTESHAETLGYTREELSMYFRPHLEAMAEKFGLSSDEMPDRLADYYNGYRFSTKDIKVFNPFSVMSALKHQAIENYWFETGTPTFLVNLLRAARWYPPKIEDMKVTRSMFSTYDLDDLKPEALLFQTGYVTIRSVENRLFTLDYPNREVKSAFLETLFHSYARGIADRSRFALLTEYLLEEDLDAFVETVQALFASIPYTLETRRDEAYFHTLFYLMVCASGANARSEVLTCEGRIDLAVEFPEKAFVIEFKCDRSADAAIRQIRDKDYAAPFRGAGKKIVLLGIGFDSEKRNISDWAWELDR